MKTLHPAVFRMGMLNVLDNASAQYCTIVFRVLVGIIGLIPLEAVAIVTLAEKLSIAFLEIPTGMLADKFGRAKVSMLGFVAVIIGYILFAISLLVDHSQIFWSYGLFITQGLMFGLSNTLTSGALDAFYQKILEDELEKSQVENREEIISSSISFAAQVGVYVPLALILLAFGTLYWFKSLGIVEYSIYIGIGLWCLILGLLYRDFKEYGDNYDKSEENQYWKIDHLKSFIQNRELFKSVTLGLIYRIPSELVHGFFILAVSQDSSLKSMEDRFLVMCLFMLGCYGPGWLLYSKVCSKTIMKLGREITISILFAILILSSICSLLLYYDLPLLGRLILVFIYGSLFNPIVYSLNAITRNMLLDQVDERLYATYLSVQSMLKYGLTSIYLSYLAFGLKNGAPTIREIFITCIYCGFIGLFLPRLISVSKRIFVE